MKYVNWFEFDWSSVVIPGSCLNGGYLNRFLLKGFVPLAVMVAVSLVGWVADIFTFKVVQRNPGRPPMLRGLLRTLPLVLFLSFSLCVSISSAIFAAWSCHEYIEDSAAGTSRFYLREDLSIRCSNPAVGYSNPTHDAITAAGWMFTVIWPIAMPLVYLCLLLPCRPAIVQKRSTALMRATSFLHREYEVGWLRRQACET